MLTTGELVIGTKEVVILPHAARMVSFEAVPERHRKAIFSEILVNIQTKDDTEDVVSIPTTDTTNQTAFAMHHCCIIIYYLTTTETDLFCFHQQKSRQRQKTAQERWLSCYSCVHKRKGH